MYTVGDDSVCPVMIVIIIVAKCLHISKISFMVCLPSYRVPSVSKILTNAILVYHPLIYKYDIDLSKYLPDLFIYGSDL